MEQLAGGARTREEARLKLRFAEAPQAVKKREVEETNELIESCAVNSIYPLSRNAIFADKMKK